MTEQLNWFSEVLFINKFLKFYVHKKASKNLLLFSRLESAAHTSESSEEFLEEEHEQSVLEFEDRTSDKEARSAPETQPHLEKQDGEKVWDHLLNITNGSKVNFNFFSHIL